MGVVIVDHDSLADTEGCLASLETSQELDMAVVVVDNSEQDGSAGRLRAGTGARAEVLPGGGNTGFAGGANRGIRHVLEQGCDYVWLLNPDTRVEPDTLPRLLQHLDEVPDCAVVGPRIIEPGKPPTVWFDGGVVGLNRHGETRHVAQGMSLDEAPAPRVLDVDYVTGASLLTRRTVLETVGLLPEHYFLYFEETEWCHRVRAAGWRVMVDQRARMLHHKRSSGHLPSPYHLYYMIRNRYLFVQRVLGGDPEAALAQMQRKWLRNWRRRVTEAAPEWLPEFDALAELAAADARAGRDGRSEAVSHVPWPHDRGEAPAESAQRAD